VGWHFVFPVPAAPNGHFVHAQFHTDCSGNEPGMLWSEASASSVKGSVLFVCVSSALYCNRICICLRDLCWRETEHAESYTYWPRARRALGVTVTDTIQDENCHNWRTFCSDWHVFATPTWFILATTAAKLFSEFVHTYARHQKRRGLERIALSIISLSARCGWVVRCLCRLSLGAGVDGRRLM